MGRLHARLPVRLGYDWTIDAAGARGRRAIVRRAGRPRSTIASLVAGVDVTASLEDRRGDPRHPARDRRHRSVVRACS